MNACETGWLWRLARSARMRHLSYKSTRTSPRIFSKSSNALAAKSRNMRFYPIALVAVALCGSAIGFPQNDDNGAQSVPTTLVDGFAFDGPADGPADRPQTGNGDTTTQSPPTTSTSTSSTSTSSTMAPTDQARYDQCIARCPVTIEYNPVCGTDNVDYSNPGGLGCAQTCGRNVALQYFGRCQTTRVRGR